MTSGNSEAGQSPPAAFDVAKVRNDFPLLRQQVNGKPLVYLDSGATSQKPQCVIDELVRYYTTENANVHRGVHTLSQLATDNYEGARSKVCRFLNAADDREIIYTRGTTESINLVASTFGRQNVGPGDEIIVSNMEHHSNIVPWQMLCEEKGARLRVVPIDENGELLLDEYEKMLNPRTKLVSITHVSNALGTILPAERIVGLAHEHGVPVLLDGAQAVPHMPVDVRKLDCEFYVFSGHKLFGPTGVGILYGKAEFLEAMPPLPGRRGYDQVGHLREDHLQRLALQVRGRHPQHCRRRGVGRGGGLRGIPGLRRYRCPRGRTAGIRRPVAVVH